MAEFQDAGDAAILRYYQLGLDWRASGEILACRFTDYEPGVHWPQTQMQAGQTGINAPRIYNPVKQGLDQDPDGRFTRRWAAELAGVPAALLQTPWRMDGDTERAAGCRIGVDYPAQIVDLAAAARAARDRFAAARREPGYRAEAEAVFRRHGSRKRRIHDDDPAKRRALRARHDRRQLALDL